MIKVENIETWGFEHAIRGMRNPLNSWDKIDSFICPGKDFVDCTSTSKKCPRKSDKDFEHDVFCIGEADLTLMRKLYVSGIEHRKYLRQIFVSMDITAPLYWWKEADTYKIGTTTNSCSTMHTIHKKEFELNDFSHEHLTTGMLKCLEDTIGMLNVARQLYVNLKKKEDWWQMIQLLPSSYNQKRTVTMNYENVISIIFQRTGHRLDEWNDFVKVLNDLPYIREIMNG